MNELKRPLFENQANSDININELLEKTKISYKKHQKRKYYSTENNSESYDWDDILY